MWPRRTQARDKLGSPARAWHLGPLQTQWITDAHLLHVCAAGTRTHTRPSINTVSTSLQGWAGAGK